MPTLVLTTQSNPGTATWTDASALTGPFLASGTYSTEVPAIPADNPWSTTITVTGATAGQPVIVGWVGNATPLLVQANVTAADTITLYLQTPSFQGFGGGPMTFRFAVFTG